MQIGGRKQLHPRLEEAHWKHGNKFINDKICNPYSTLIKLYEIFS
jgi:hypothetical protein